MMPMQKKILFCATVDYHFRLFHLPYFKWFKEKGWDVHVAASGSDKLPYVDKKYTIPIQRSPLDKKNIEAFKALKLLIRENQYNIVHSHTPVGGVLARLAARNARKRQTRVIYTAHGFHFCKGAPWKNWAIYYPIEKWLSRFTDCLITINEEDYQLAVTHQFRSGHIEHVHGVGVDTNIFFPVNQFQKSVLRAEHHYLNDAFLMFYAAEFNHNKNQKVLIEALSLIKEQIPNARLLLAGTGYKMEECQRLSVDLGVDDMVKFLGYRKDIESLLKLSDVAVASSFREGLPVNIMEAMACGLPVIAMDNRGHRELVVNGKNGWIVGNDPNEISQRMMALAQNQELKKIFGIYSRKLIQDKYNLAKTLEELSKIYERFMGDMEEAKWAVQ